VAAKAELTSRMEEEAKISKVNGLKILNQWRKLMRIFKTESLKKDVEILSKAHERDVSRKDAILHMLDR
jgi:dynein regulatory complex subunit 2